MLSFESTYYSTNYKAIFAAFSATVFKPFLATYDCSHITAVDATIVAAKYLPNDAAIFNTDVATYIPAIFDTFISTE